MTNYVMVSEALIRPLFLFELLDDTLVGFTFTCVTSFFVDDAVVSFFGDGTPTNF